MLICEKPAGLAVQSAKPGQADMVSALKNYRVKQGEDPYIGLVHRLDQPVTGLMVFAKTKKAAAYLAEQVRNRRFLKEYTATVWGNPAKEEARCPVPDEDGRSWYQLHDFLLRDGRTNTSRVVPEGTPDAKEALLFYKVLEFDEQTNHSRVHIRLHTGRHHQIRVQFAHAGFPLYGDTKYGQPLPAGSYVPVALRSCKIGFFHPVTGQWMVFGED